MRRCVAIFCRWSAVVNRARIKALTLLRLQPAKLLYSKWTATVPVDREKHFMVTSPIALDVPSTQVDTVTMEAVPTGRSFILRWRELKERTGKTEKIVR